MSPNEKFSREFRERAVQTVIGTSRPIAQVARELGLNPATLGNWVRVWRKERVGLSSAPGGLADSLPPMSPLHPSSDKSSASSSVDLRVGDDGVLRVPKAVVVAEGLRPKDRVYIRLRKSHLEEPISSNRLRLIIYTMILGSVGAAGGLLIDWPHPLLVGFSIPVVGINLTAFLFPLGYVVIKRTAKRETPREFIYLLLGLFYGSVLWLQVILEVFLRTSLGEKQKLGYLQGHAYDLFAVAAIVGAVGYFSADRRRIVRISSLATVFAVTGVITGFTEAEYLWENRGLSQLNHYPYWVLPLLWALTGIWYGLCVGFLAPEKVLAQVLRGE